MAMRSAGNALTLFAAFMAFAMPGAAWAGDGTLPTQPAGSPFAAGMGPESIAVGDFNSDGIQDIAVANSDSDNVTVRLGAGNGTFPTLPAGSPYAAGDGPSGVAVGDFDGDGDEDLAIANFASDDVTVRLGAGNGTFPTVPAGSPFPAGDGPTEVGLGDFDNDGDDDIAVANFMSDDVTIRRGTAAGGFPNEVVGSPFSGGVQPSSMAIGDFNNDGDDDLALTSFFLGNVTVRLGGGNGSFATAGTGFAAGTASFGIVAGDFNSDGNDDLAVSNRDSSNVTVRLGNGSGAFPSESVGSPYATVSNARALAVGDFNTDANEDLAVATTTAGVPVLLGAGNGSFPSRPPGSPFGAGTAPRAIAVGDFNSDGNEDLAIANEAGNSFTVRLGAGPPWESGNLLANGGAEGAGVARTAAGSPQVPGWTRTGGALTYVRYSVPGFAQHVDAARWEGGLGFFAGGPGAASSSATQTVDVSGSAASIDAGLATARLSALLGGFLTSNDRMQASAGFRDGAGTELGTAAIGPVPAADRKNHTELLPRAATAAVPVGTRSIAVTLTATRADGSYNDGYADNVKLTLTAPPPPTGDGGGGGDDGGGGGGNGGGQLTRTLTLRYSEKSDKFKGVLDSNEPSCEAGNVKVFEKAKGPDPKVGSDKTNGAGKWTFKERGADGKFFATVAEKAVPAGTCPAAKSRARKVD